MIKIFQIKHLKIIPFILEKNLQFVYFSVAKSFQKKSYSISFNIIVSPRDWFQTPHIITQPKKSIKLFPRNLLWWKRKVDKHEMLSLSVFKGLFCSNQF